MSDEIYLAALVDTIIDNQYLTREFEMAHPQILIDAKAATKRVHDNAAQQGLHPTSGTLRGLDDLSTPEVNPAPEVLSTPPTCG